MNTRLSPRTHAAGRCLEQDRASAKKSKGFTILEVVIAAAIMVLAITSSLTVLQRAFLALDSARKVTLAGQMMQSAIEKMRLESWTTISGYATSEDITSTVTSSFASSNAITGTFTITRDISDVHTDMKQITLTTTWKSFDGRTSSRSYVTYYGRNGLYDYYYNSY